MKKRAWAQRLKKSSWNAWEDIRDRKCEDVLSSYQRHQIKPELCNILLRTVCSNKLQPHPKPTGTSGKSKYNVQNIIKVFDLLIF